MAQLPATNMTITDWSACSNGTTPTVTLVNNSTFPAPGVGATVNNPNSLLTCTTAAHANPWIGTAPSLSGWSNTSTTGLQYTGGAAGNNVQIEYNYTGSGANTGAMCVPVTTAILQNASAWGRADIAGLFGTGADDFVLTEMQGTGSYVQINLEYGAGTDFATDSSFPTSIKRTMCYQMNKTGYDYMAAWDSSGNALPNTLTTGAAQGATTYLIQVGNGPGAQPAPSGYTITFGTIFACGTVSSSTGCNFPLAPGLQLFPAVDSPGTGSYSSAQTVTISDSPSSGAICYTVDGTTPTASNGTCTHGTTYLGSFTISGATILKEIASLNYYANSVVNTSYYKFTGCNASNLTTSPDASSFQTCLNDATSGQQVNVMPGSATWTSQVSTSTPVIISGQTSCTGSGDQYQSTSGIVSCTDNTIITLASSGGQLSTSGCPTRITGITFEQTYAQYNGGVTMSGTHASPNCFRYDHNHNTLTQEVGLEFNTAYGVVDHNLIQDDTTSSAGLLILADGDLAGAGYQDWTDTTQFGSAYSTRIEQNEFTTTNSSPYGALDSHPGGKITFRFNTLESLSMGTVHGTDTGPSTRGVVFVEAYGNLLNWSNAGFNNVFSNRGGSLLFWGNKVQGSNWTAVDQQYYRYWNAPANSVWGVAGPSLNWTPVSNVITNSGATLMTMNASDFSASHAYAALAVVGPLTNNSGAYNYQLTNGPKTCGTYPGSWNQTLWGTTTDSASCVWENVGGSTQASPAPGTAYGFCAANPDTTCAANSTCNALSSGDTCTRYFDTTGGVYPFRDMPGRIHNQVLAPDYDFVNTGTGLPSPVLDTDSQTSSIIVANRDFYDYNGSFTGASGTGSGVRASRPSSCTPLVLYFSTDQGSWNTSGNGFGNGVADECLTPNTWTNAAYTPYTYPDPLENGGTNFTLTISIIGSGSVSGTNCSTNSYVSGTSVGNCTPIASAGYVFTGWSNACSGMGNCSLTLTSNQTITATFVATGEQFLNIETQTAATVLNTSNPGWNMNNQPADTGGVDTPASMTQTNAQSTPAGGCTSTSQKDTLITNPTTTQSNGLWWYWGAGDDSATNFVEEACIYVTNIAAANNIEMDFDQYNVTQGKLHSFGHQYNIASGCWQYANNSSGWQTTSVCPSFAGNTWHHIIWTGHQDSGHNYYDCVTQDGTTYCPNATLASESLGALPTALISQVQIDAGPTTGTPATVSYNVDNVNFSAYGILIPGNPFLTLGP
jgi:hypothetical protein